MTRPRQIIAAILGIFLILFGGPAAQATQWNDAAELAREVAGVTGPGAISLSVHNASDFAE
jgi:hypothetical protein